MAERLLAIVQKPPVMLDLVASLEKAVGFIHDAADQGATLVVFPETWLTCYPAWIFGMAGWGDNEARAWHARLLQESPVIGASDDMADGIAPLREVACERQVTVFMGLNERSHQGGTIYNSQAVLGPRGTLLNLHRKLIPTHTERIVWGMGDAAGLRAVDTPTGRVGGLICWEHWMPLARQTLHAYNEQIHIAAWPDITEMHSVVARCYAFEGRCFAVSAGLFLEETDVPTELRTPYRAGVDPDLTNSEVVFNGGSAVISPDGEWIISPVYGRSELIVASIDLDAIDCTYQDLDVVGHYARPDIFSLTVDARRRTSGVFIQNE